MQTTQSTDQVDRVAGQAAQALALVMAIDPDELLELVNDAHQSKWRDQLDPAPRMAVTRQALRMLWRFRIHLDGVSVTGDLD